MKARARPISNLIVALWVCLCTGCASSVQRASHLSPPPLPDALSNQVHVTTQDEEFKVQVATFLNDDLSRRHFVSELRAEGILGVYMRVENRSPTRVLIASPDCHLYGKDGDEYREIPQLNLEQTTEPFLVSTWPSWAFEVPIGILTIPLFFVGVKTLIDSSRKRAAIRRFNSIVYENFLGWRWGRRALSPGAIEKGVLFFDWELAEDYRDELYLAIDMRDLVNDWHTVLPVKLKITYEDGWFSTTYY